MSFCKATVRVVVPIPCPRLCSSLQCPEVLVIATPVHMEAVSLFHFLISAPYILLHRSDLRASQFSNRTLSSPQHTRRLLVWTAFVVVISRTSRSQSNWHAEHGMFIWVWAARRDVLRHEQAHGKRAAFRKTST